jgi:hypothetical protein
MHLQRIIIISLSFIGIISTFLPWFTYDFLLVKTTENGIDSNGNGWFTIILFTLCIILSVLSELNNPINNKLSIGIILAALLSTLIVIIELLSLEKQSDNIIGEILRTSIEIGVGIYLLIFCGITIPIIILVLKNKK